MCDKNCSSYMQDGSLIKENFNITEAIPPMMIFPGRAMTAVTNIISAYPNIFDYNSPLPAIFYINLALTNISHIWDNGRLRYFAVNHENFLYIDFITANIVFACNIIHQLQPDNIDFKELSQDYNNFIYNENHKQTAGKTRLVQFPYKAYDAVVMIMWQGIKKYGDGETWRQVNPVLYIEAGLRHINKCKSDDGVQLLSLDYESGQKHIDHAATDLIFACEIIHSILEKKQNIL